MSKIRAIRKNYVHVASVLAILLSLLIVRNVIADTETKAAYIGGTSVTLYAQGNAFDLRDGYNAGGSWISRSSPERTSIKGFNPASVWSTCGIGGFEIDRSTPVWDLPETGWASATRYITYRDLSCNFSWPQREVIAQCKHALYHDYGIWEPWTTSSIVINCTQCDPW